VDRNFYKSDEVLKNWVTDCYKRAFQYPLNADIESWLIQVRRNLQNLDISHLDIWDPESTKATFLGQSRETGIRARKVEGHFIIFQLVENGPAQQAKLNVGDEVFSINGVPPNSEGHIKFTPGHFVIDRQGVQFEVDVGGEVLTVDLSPQLEWDESGNALLQIPSFTRYYLEKEQWLEIVGKIKTAPGVILDLRGNPGGDFVAMLRVLSTFRCDLKSYGKLIQNRSGDEKSFEIFPESEAAKELTVMESAKTILLQRYEGYPCLTMPVVVLIDGHSTSTAEILGQMMKGRKDTRVLGDFTDGSVVTASFFDLPLGQLYKMTIPIAMYVTPEGDELEGVGVRPEALLSYKLSEAKLGEDSWVNIAISNLKGRK
jgi:carboxyl-terminal processing protease